MTLDFLMLNAGNLPTAVLKAIRRPTTDSPSKKARSAIAFNATDTPAMDAARDALANLEKQNSNRKNVMSKETPLSERLFEGLKKELSKAGIDLNPDKKLHSATRKACELVAEMAAIPGEFEKAVTDLSKKVDKDFKKKSLYQKVESFYSDHPGQSLFGFEFLALELNAFMTYLDEKGCKPSIAGHPTIESALSAQALSPKEVIADFLIQHKQARDKFEAFSKSK